MLSVVEGVMRRKSAAKWESARGSTEIALRACLIARDAAFNVQDYIATKSQMAFIAVQQCEKELDQIERQIDASGCTYFVCRLTFGNMKESEASASIDLFTSEVMPALIKLAPAAS